MGSDNKVYSNNRVSMIIEFIRTTARLQPASALFWRKLLRQLSACHQWFPLLPFWRSFSSLTFLAWRRFWPWPSCVDIGRKLRSKYCKSIRTRMRWQWQATIAFHRWSLLPVHLLRRLFQQSLRRDFYSSRHSSRWCRNTAWRDFLHLDMEWRHNYQLPLPRRHIQMCIGTAQRWIDDRTGSWILLRASASIVAFQESKSTASSHIHPWAYLAAWFLALRRSNSIDFQARRSCHLIAHAFVPVNIEPSRLS